jgi:hypothetical protein
MTSIEGTRENSCEQEIVVHMGLISLVEELQELRGTEEKLAADRTCTGLASTSDYRLNKWMRSK